MAVGGLRLGRRRKGRKRGAVQPEIPDVYGKQCSSSEGGPVQKKGPPRVWDVRYLQTMTHGSFLCLLLIQIRFFQNHVEGQDVRSVERLVGRASLASQIGRCMPESGLDTRTQPVISFAFLGLFEYQLHLYLNMEPRGPAHPQI